MMHVLLTWLTLQLTTNQISKEQRRDHQEASATGRRMIAGACGESINPREFFWRPPVTIIPRLNVIRRIAFPT